MQNQVTTLQDAIDTRFFAPLRRLRTRRVGVARGETIESIAIDYGSAEERRHA